MANSNSPFGLALANAKNAYYSGVLAQCYVPASDSNALFIGDAVKLATGSNSSEILGHKAGTLPIVAKVAATDKIDGVIVGILPNGSSYMSGKKPASTEAVVFVILNPMAKFNIQANGAVTAAMVGKYAKLSLSTAGNDYTGISGMALDISTVATDDTLPLKIVDIANDYPLDALGNYSVCVVELNDKVGLSAYQGKLTAGTGIAISDANVISVSQQ